MKLPDYANRMIEEAQKGLFGWIPYDRYRAMFPEENRERIRGRMRRGVWKLGVHVAIAGKHDMWVHLRNAKAWLEGRPPEEDPFKG